MRHLQTRLTVGIFMVAISVCVLSLLFSYLIRANIVMVRDKTQFLFFGFAMRDVLLIVAAVVMLIFSVTAITRGTSDPIKTLSNATKEIAQGNFDVQVSLRDKAEEFAELQNNFNLMAKELKANELLKRDFVSSVSHELKTPLSVIEGYASLLQQPGLPEEEQREYLRTIASEASRLSVLTGNMLRLSRIESEKIQLRPSRFSLSEQLRQSVLQLEPKWTAKELEPEIDLEELDYEGDAELLGQVWYNLIENAVKYSETGGLLQVSLRRDGDGLRVSVRDTGCGMEEETRLRCFDSFFQGDTSHKSEGSGLGLALVQRITELHGGSVTVESAPGKGSCFSVFLPNDRQKARESA